MHIAYWGLTHSPFASQLDPKDYYPSGLHEEALARLDFLIANGRRLGFLLGSSGTGKSLLLEVAARQLRRSNCQLVKFNVVGLGAQEVVWKLATSLGNSSTSARFGAGMLARHQRPADGQSLSTPLDGRAAGRRRRRDG